MVAVPIFKAVTSPVSEFTSTTEGLLLFRVTLAELLAGHLQADLADFADTHFPISSGRIQGLWRFLTMTLSLKLFLL